jgi:hypothetical protein
MIKENAFRSEYVNVPRNNISSWCTVSKGTMLHEKQTLHSGCEHSEAVREGRFGLPCTAVSTLNEELLDQLVSSNRRKPSTLTATSRRWLNWRPESPVMPETRTTFLLKHDNTRPHTSLKAMEHVAKFGWTALPLPPHSPGLAPSLFHLFRPMKHGLHRKHFPDNDAIIAAVRNRVDCSGSDFYERNIQALVTCWLKCIACGGDYMER